MFSDKPFTYALSWSRLSDFQQCPRKFKLKYIDKAKNFQEDPNNKSVHLVRGTNVHAALENYLVKRNSGQNEIPPSSLEEVENTKPLIENFRKNFDTVHPEQQVSINSQWKQVDWFDKSSYYRAIYDLVALSQSTCVIGDYKTGKFKDYSADQPGQLELSATIAMNMWPSIPKIVTMYIYVDHKKTITREFTQEKHREELTTHFVRQHEIVNSEKNFDPKSNDFCRWCEATKAQCQYSRKL